MKLSRRRKVIVAGTVFAVLVAGTLGTTAAATADSVLSGVLVGGIPVSGLEANELREKLLPAANAVDDRSLTLFVGERNWSRTPGDLGVGVDLEATIGEALEAGRTSPLSWLSHTIGSKRSAITWQARVNRQKLREAIRSLSNEVAVAAANGEVKMDGSRVEVKPPTEGVSLLPTAAEKELIAAAMNPRPKDRVALPVTITPPQIGAQETERIRLQAEAILSSSASFIFEDNTFELTPDRISKTLRVRAISDPESGDVKESLVLQADPAAIEAQIVEAAPFVKRLPKDASFKVEGDKVRVLPAEEGRTADTSQAALLILTLGRGSRAPIELPSRVEAPAFTTEAATALGITTRVATFTTRFDAQNAPRVANIDLMASAINGTVLAPGESFSLNAATGPRTPQNGYQEAQVIVDGELVPGIGGGVCQVATTLYNAVFNAGLDVTERINHSLYISKYPIGRDATVNYGFQDLQFKNDTSSGLYLQAVVSSKAMTVSIFSSPLGRTVETTTSERRNPKPPSVKYVDDPSLPAGQEVVEEPGADGFDITVTRVVRRGDEILHQDTFVSKYRPWKRIIRRGTGPPASPSPSPTA